ncbi:MAG: RES family NAD+ phosphorylase [Chloroflexota bacterium]
MATISPATHFFRVENLTVDQPVFRDSFYRFNAPNHEFLVLYLGASLDCAFIEKFGSSTGKNLVSVKALTGVHVLDIETVRRLVLADLTGPGLARIGADDRICKGDDYDLSQRWALGVHGHPRQVDGILYGARHDPSLRSVALFDRASDAVVSAGECDSFFDRVRLEALLEKYGFALLGDLAVSGRAW